MLFFLIFTLIGCQTEDEKQKLHDIYKIATIIGYKGTLEEWKTSFKDNQGIPGKSIELSVVDGYIKWRNIGDTSWYNLVSLDMLKDENGLSPYENFILIYSDYNGDETI